MNNEDKTMIHHPIVSLFWNFFPMTLIVWTPLRELLNLPLELIRIVFMPFTILWNFIPESIIFWLLNTLIPIYGIEPLFSEYFKYLASVNYIEDDKSKELKNTAYITYDLAIAGLVIADLMWFSIPFYVPTFFIALLGFAIFWIYLLANSDKMK